MTGRCECAANYKSPWMPAPLTGIQKSSTQHLDGILDQKNDSGGMVIVTKRKEKDR